MKACCWQGVEDVQVRKVPDPELINPRDAILRITSTAICGSDLHLYDGKVPSMVKGDILGHEFMGVVEEVGPNVKNLKRGDRVLTAGGIIAQVTRVKDGVDEIEVEIAPNVRVNVLRQTISDTFKPAGAEAKAEPAKG